MRSILLHVYVDDCFEARFQAALNLAEQFDGRINCVQAVPYDFASPGEFYGAISAEIILEYNKTAKQERSRIEARLQKADVSWRWVRGNDHAIDMISTHAPLNDVVVLGAHNALERPATPSRFVAELTERVRAPLLVVPEKTNAFDLAEPAMVAWNGAREAAHALRTAVPLLSRARSVHILNVAEIDDADRFELPSTMAAEYLALHGIEAEIVELKQDSGKSIAQTLMDGATIRGGSYMVMGAYGHSRFRERILGGVTRDMLRDPQLPLLLSH